jgi:hypothetical protein
MLLSFIQLNQLKVDSGGFLNRESIVSRLSHRVNTNVRYINLFNIAVFNCGCNI